jgi:NAD-dependent deacetylase
MDLETRIREASDLMNNASHAIALTGAGHSTPSGIPDFRSGGSGMWEKVNPMEVASIFTFRSRPQAFYDWVRPLLDMMLNARPNPGHMALAQLEAVGRLRAVITQNIDGLHQMAGSESVLEVHGHLRGATCLDCYSAAPAAEALEAVVQGEIPHCSKCGGVLKPDVVLFGEQLPVDVLGLAMEHVRRADVMLVAGSSLRVMPVAHLPTLVHEAGGKVIIVNHQETYADQFADVVFREDLAEVLPRIAAACLGDEC